MKLFSPRSKVYGSKNWEPLGVEENAQLEKFIIENDTNKYEKKWETIYKTNGVPDNRIGKIITEFIDKKIQDKTVFSIIRVNDGEGTVIFGEHFKGYDQSLLDHYISKRISYIIFGSHSVIPEEINTFRRLLISSMDNADILGIPEKSFIRRRLDEEDKKHVDVRAVLGSYAQISYLHDRKYNKSKVFMSPWLSKYLLPHYHSIFLKFKHIAIITGNVNLGMKIKQHFDLDDVAEILIPTQRSMLDTNAPLHWPNRYFEVLEEIKNLAPNTLVLVAAGILGKPYCNAVKLSNNCAIDIGHVADIWDGNVTRPGIKAHVEKWAL